MDRNWIDESLCTNPVRYKIDRNWISEVLCTADPPAADSRRPAAAAPLRGPRRVGRNMVNNNGWLISVADNDGL